MFVLEDEDVLLLNNFEEEIERALIFAIDVTNKVVASCCMMTPCEENIWTIEKFATRKELSGQGTWIACLLAYIDDARRQGAGRLIIVSNTKCAQALRIYMKHGFNEIPIDKEIFPFARGNISFELRFTDTLT